MRASKLPLDSYVKYTEAGAVVDSSYLVKPEERKLANGVRTVVDAVTTKADAAKVRLILLLQKSPIFHEEDIQFPDAESGPVLGAPLQ